jgi:hypothetical protein
MDAKFLALSLPWWGVLCLAIALIFCFIWPAQRLSPATSTLAYLMLRWGHALVWLFLALFCFTKASNLFGLGSQAQGFALLAGLTYALFLFTMLRK